MNGNISKEGIRKDLLWMSRVGIGGVHIFDAGKNTPQVVKRRIVYMTPEWKDCYAYAVSLADSLGMEVTMTSTPGWSNTGGPWVQPHDAMKKLVWRETTVVGGKAVDIVLPSPYRTTGAYQNMRARGTASKQQYYEDIAVVAVPVSAADLTMAEMGATATSSSNSVSIATLTDGDMAKTDTLRPEEKGKEAWVQIALSHPYTIKALSIKDGTQHSQWRNRRPKSTKWLEASDDGIHFRKVCDIPIGAAPLLTIDIAPTTAKYFRVCFASSRKEILLGELTLHTVYKVNHSAEKAAFATPIDIAEFATPATEAAPTLADVVDLTSLVDENGRLRWSAPKGKWRIYRFGYSLTGKMNHPASPEATGLEVDKLDGEAVKRYLDTFLAYYEDASGGKMGAKGIQNILIDSYEAGIANWTKRMPDEFKARRGYDLVKWLPALAGEVVNSGEETDKFLFDWRQTLSDLIADNLYGQVAKTAKARGMGAYIESHESCRVMIADGMQLKQHATVPMGCMWASEPVMRVADSGETCKQGDIRESASVAHLYGQNIVAAESLTSNGTDGDGIAYSLTPNMLKPVADLELSCGLNRFVIHDSAHQPIDDKVPGQGLEIYGQWFHRHETWAEQARPWVDYLSRSSYLLQQGQNVADVLYYYGDDANVTGLFYYEQPRVPSSYAYDYVNTAALNDQIYGDGGDIASPSGVRYRLLALDKNTQRMTLATLRKLATMVKSGVSICGERPSHSPSLTDDKKEFEQLSNDIWNTGRKNVYTGMSIAEALTAMGVRPDFVCNDMDSLRYVHRTTADGEIYWVNNRSHHARKLQAEFRVQGLTPQIWHPETAKAMDVNFKTGDGVTIVDLQMLPREAFFVVFRPTTQAGAAKAQTVLVERPLKTIDTPWKLTFQPDRGAPAEATLDSLISLSESADEGIRYFAGAVTYTNHVNISSKQLKGGQLWLDLGRVNCLAEVSVNGKPLGTLWRAPFKVDITSAARKGDNIVEIKVTTLWRNRIIGDQQANCKRRYTYTSYPFYKANSKLKPSGLMGPVTLVKAVAASEAYTAGIGVYPGRSSERFAPTLEVDSGYRNVALHRKVYQSSAADANLTAQLVTDGHVFQGTPAYLSASSHDREFAVNDKEKTLDGNIHSLVNLMGEDTWLQLDWKAMNVTADELKITAQAVYEDTKAHGGYRIRVLSSADGSHWQCIGSEQGDTLPGKSANRKVSSDPNKREAPIMLPMRELETTLRLSPTANSSHIRVEFQMEGCAYWRLYETEFRKDGIRQDPLPSTQFTSAWMSGGGGAEWLAVDLGSVVKADKINLFWIHAPRKCGVFVSNDGRSWTKIRQFRGQRLSPQTLKLSFEARYLKLAMEKPDKSGRYALSEIEVMGRGGMSAVAHARKGMECGKYYLNGGDWKLRRKGSDAAIVATVPATVLTSYANIGAIPNTNVGDNMRMVSESYFNSDFTYTTTFDMPADFNGKHVDLNFDGINWKANVYLNGAKLGRIEGAFMRGRFDVTAYVKPQGNQLTVEIERVAHPGAVKIKTKDYTDLNGGYLGADNPTFHASIGWDWITSTPGRNIGIWNDVYLSATNGLSVSDPLVTTCLDSISQRASMTPRVVVGNRLPTATVATVSGWIGDISFSKQVELPGNSHTEVVFSPDEYSQLRNREMHLWWPVGYGAPYLYDAGFSIDCNGVRSDSLHYKVGIREMTYRNLGTQAKLYINGKRFVPMGGNWGFSETNLNYRGREYDAAVAYHRSMGMNMIRNWVGQVGDDEFFAACDRHGVMAWQDFWLANPWDGPDPDDNSMFLANADDFLHRIRHHACIGIYCGRNEGYPPEQIDSTLRRQVSSLHPGIAYIASSADEGVSGHGPYWSLPTSEYFVRQSHKLHTERGMPAVPSLESLQRMLSPEVLWPIGTPWGQHDFTQQGAQRGSTFVDRMKKHFGEPADADAFAKWAQWINYDGYRAMFESMQQDRLGLLIWMSHPCWPTMVWQTYDYYLEPTAAYFGAKKGCETLHIQYHPLKRCAQVVNLKTEMQQGLAAKAEVMDMYGKRLWADSAVVAVDGDQTVDVLPISVPLAEGVYYLRFTLSHNGTVVSDNFYVEGVEEDNLKQLMLLPKAELSVCQQLLREQGPWRGSVTLSNDSQTPALMIRMNLKGSDGEQILPAFYADNYFSLMPGERRTVNIECKDEDTRGCEPRIEVSWFNE